MNINEELTTYINMMREEGLTDEEIISHATETYGDIVGNLVATKINFDKSFPHGLDILEGVGKWTKVE